MADHDVTQTLAFDSQSPSHSSPSGSFAGDRFQHTVIWDDTMDLHSPLAETRLENLYFDTEVVDDGDCVEKIPGEPVREYEEKVVLDSEDEGICRTEVVSFVEGKTCRKGEMEAADMRNGQLCTRSEPNEDRASDSYTSFKGQFTAGKKESPVNFEGNDGKKKGLPQLSACDHEPGRLNYTNSQEPEESPQAIALGFVDNFLKFNVNLSQEAEPRKTMMVKSYAVSSAKGAQLLANRTKMRTAVKDSGTFEWVENHHMGEVDFFSKGLKESSNLGGTTQKTALKYLDIKGVSSLDNEHEEKREFIYIHKDTRGPRQADTGFMEQCEKETFNTYQVSESSSINGSVKELDEHLQAESFVQGVDEHIPDTFDVGINTQIAAEAMEALFYGGPSGLDIDNTYQGPGETNEDTLRSVIKSKTHSEQHFLRNTAASELNGIAKQSIRRKRSSRRFSKRDSGLVQKYDNQNLDPELAIKTKDKKSKQEKAEEAVGSNNIKKNKLCMSSSVQDERILLSKGLSKGDPAVHQTWQKMRGNRMKGTINQSDNRGETTNEIVKGGILTYRRKRKGQPVFSAEKTNNVKEVVVTYRRKRTRAGSSLTDRRNRKDQPDFSAERTNNVKEVVTYRRKRTHAATDPLNILCGKQSKQDQTSQQVASLSRFLTFDARNYPKGKRTYSKKPKRSEAASARHTSHSIAGQIISENDKKTTKEPMPTGLFELSLENGQNFDEQGSAIAYTDSAVTNMSIIPLGLSEKEAFTVIGKKRQMDTGSLIGARKHGFGVSSDNNAKFSGIECTATKNINAALFNNVACVYHKRPCNKNLPKSSFLKELISLGVPETIPDFSWKGLRRRRVVAYVRVLFSQHLDDDIIKQQKKIAARLGISITTCSKDATHFIADGFVRTRNMLEAIALGKPVVTHLWLESCGQASCLLDEKNYILRDTKKEKEIGFSMPVSLSRASQYPLLKGKRVCITPNVKPDKDMIVNLVKAVQGQAVEESQILDTEDQNIPDDLLILSSEKDHPVCAHLLDKGAAVYSPELLLNGIIIQKLEYERHRIFTTYVRARRKMQERKRPSTR